MPRSALAARRTIGRGLATAAGGITWLLRDDFTTDLAAGSVNGTAAEPGPGTRTVVDTGNYLSLNGGNLFLSARQAIYEPRLLLNSLSRQAGLLMVSKISIETSVSNQLPIGFGNIFSSSFDFHSNGTVRFGSAPIGAWTFATDYTLAYVLRAAGCLIFMKGGSYGNWSLLWRNDTETGSQNPIVSSINVRANACHVDFIRVPDALWLPAPLASDGFGSAFGTTDGLGHAEGIAGGIGAGGSGVTWSNVGATWSVSGGKAINTPTLGANILINSGFDTDTDWIKGATWSIAAGVATKSGAGDHLIYQSATSYKWRRVSFDVTTNNGNIYAYSGGLSNIITGTGTKTAILRPVVGVNVGVNSTATSVVIDNAIAYDLVLAELFSLVNTACADVMVSAGVVIAGADRPAGLALSWDNLSSPTNGVIISQSSPFGIQVLKCVSGIWTDVSTTAYTYSTGARLVVAKNGTEYRVYYNNTFIVAATISDASIVSNTLHGLFSTDASNTLDNFTCYATGTGGEYATLDQYIQP